MPRIETEVDAWKNAAGGTRRLTDYKDKVILSADDAVQLDKQAVGVNQNAVRQNLEKAIDWHTSGDVDSNFLTEAESIAQNRGIRFTLFDSQGWVIAAYGPSP